MTWQWNFFQEPIESSQKLPWQGFQKKPTKDKKGEEEGEKGSQKGGGRGSQKLESNQKPYMKTSP